MSIQPIPGGTAPLASRPATETGQGSATPATARVGLPAGVVADSAVAVEETQLKQAVNTVKEAFKSVAQDLHFSIDEDTGKTIVKVVDTATKNVIRQIPSEELLQIARSLEKLDKLKGVLVTQQA